VLPFLGKSLRDASNETVQTGACLGLGVAGMATDDQGLKLLLFARGL
jgi:hypothetical protein